MRKDGLLYVPSPEAYPKKNLRRNMKKPEEVKRAYQEAFSGDKPYRAAAELLCDFMDLLNVLRSFGKKERVDCMAQEIEYIIEAWETLTSSKKGGKAV